MSFGKILAQKYTDKKIINKNDTEIYAYLFDSILSSFTYDLLAILIGIITNKLFESLIFLYVTAAIRKFSGGYHAKTKIRCTILSYSVFIFYLITISLITINNRFFHIIVFILSSFLILLISHVECENKHFTPDDKRKLHLRLKLSFIIISLFTSIMFVLNYTSILFCINLCLIICAFSLYWGYYKIRSNHNESTNSNL